jgi:hypothetical protein
MNEKPEFQGRVITFLKYLFYFPITKNIRIPNFRTFLWIFLLTSMFFKYFWITVFLLIILLIIYIIDEYQSKRYIDWYRSRKYKIQKEALKKVREERKLKGIPKSNEVYLGKPSQSSIYKNSIDEQKEGEGGSDISPNPQL